MNKMVVIALLVGCTGTESVDGVRAAIAGGMASDNESVVFTFASSGSSCSAAVIGPRHVLTSKLCVFNGESPDSRITVAGGPDSSASTFNTLVAEVVATPGGSNVTEIPDNDMVVLITVDELPAPSLSLATTSPAADDILTIVGYGQSATAGSGPRREAEITVTRVEDDLIYAEGNEASVCSGDGPALDASGALAGTAVFVYGEDGLAPGCPAFGNAFRDVAQYRDFINDALMLPDAGMDDAGMDDAGMDDGGAPPDTATIDADMGVAATGSGGGGCSASGTPPSGLLALALLWRRRQ